MAVRYELHIEPAVNDADRWVWVLGVYRRPPYDYKDLADLANRLPKI